MISAPRKMALKQAHENEIAAIVATCEVEEREKMEEARYKTVTVCCIEKRSESWELLIVCYSRVIVWALVSPRFVKYNRFDFCKIRRPLLTR